MENYKKTKEKEILSFIKGRKKNKQRQEYIKKK